MSRIGKKPIEIPEGVEIKIENQKIMVKGPKGELQKEVRPEIKVVVKEGKIFLAPQKETKQTKAFWGLTRSLLYNMVNGVTEGYEKKLQVEGLGFRADPDGNDLILRVGFTRPAIIKAPAGIKFQVEKKIITVSGIDKELVGQIAAKIRRLKPPEPYKGKGIRYVGEQVRRKVGKRVVTAG